MLKRKFALATARTLMDDGFTKIAALGIAEGAAGAIMAQAEQPVFTAIVADSSYANLERLFMRSPSMSRLNPAFLSTVMWEAQFWFGRKLDKISPETDAGKLGSCALLIIQNRDDQVTPAGGRPGDPRLGRLQRADVDGAVLGSRRRAVRGSCRIRRTRNQIS